MAVVFSQSRLGKVLRKVSYKYLSFNEEYLSGTEYLKRKVILFVLFSVLNASVGFAAHYIEIIVALMSVAISDVVLGLKRARSIGMNKWNSYLLIFSLVVASMFVWWIYDAYETQNVTKLITRSFNTDGINTSPKRLTFLATGIEIVRWAVGITFVFGNSDAIVSQEIKTRIRPLSLISLERQMDLVVLLEKEKSQRKIAGLSSYHLVFPYPIEKVLMAREGWTARADAVRKMPLYKHISDLSGSSEFCFCCFSKGKITPLVVLKSDEISTVRKMKLRNGELREVNHNRELKTYLEQNPIL